MTDVAELFRSDSYSHRVAAMVRGHAAQRGLQQKDLARALNYGQPQISKRMRGQVAFTLDELAILAQLFQVQPSELMPKCAVRDLNPEPAGLVHLSDVIASETEGFRDAMVLPFMPHKIRRPGDWWSTTHRARHRTNTPERVHLAVAR